MMPLATRLEPAPKVLLAEAEERGRLAGAEEARAACEQARLAERAEYERLLADERRRWIEETGGRLGRQIDDGFRELEAQLADSVGRVLQPFLATAVKRRALDELVQTLALLKSSGQVRVRVSGPEELLALVRQPLEAHVGAVEYSVGEGSDLRVFVDDTIVETRMAAWGERIRSSLEGEPHG